MLTRLALFDLSSSSCDLRGHAVLVHVVRRLKPSQSDMMQCKHERRPRKMEQSCLDGRTLEAFFLMAKGLLPQWNGPQSYCRQLDVLERVASGGGKGCLQCLSPRPGFECISTTFRSFGPRGLLWTRLAEASCMQQFGLVPGHEKSSRLLHQHLGMLCLVAASSLVWIEGTADDACAQVGVLRFTPPEAFLTEFLGLHVSDRCVASLAFRRYFGSFACGTLHGSALADRTKAVIWHRCGQSIFLRKAFLTGMASCRRPAKVSFGHVKVSSHEGQDTSQLASCFEVASVIRRGFGLDRAC